MLEVLIAITLTAMVLGSVFVLQSQSKRLVFRAMENLRQIHAERAAINLSWIGLEEDMPDQYHLENKQILPLPEKIDNTSVNATLMKYELEQYHLFEQGRGNLYQITRMVDK